MLFRWIAMASVLVVPACGNSTMDKQSNFEVGRKPELYNAAYLWGANDSQNVVIIDRAGHTLQHFQLEPFQHQKTIKLPLKTKDQGVLASVGASYYVTIAEDDYAIVKSDGSTQINPIDMLGTIETAAFDPENHVLVLADSFQTLALLVFSHDGTVQGTWKAGSLFNAEKYILSGSMLSDGRLFLALEGGTIAIVDVAKSVAEQRWSYTSFELPDANAIDWVATVPDQKDVVLLTDSSRILTVNVQTKAVIDTADLGYAVVGKFRDYAPHIATRPSAEIVTIYYVGADGQLEQQTMKGSTSLQISQSFLDPETSMLTVVYDANSSYADSSYQSPEYQKSEVYRFRLEDNLALDLTTINDPANLVVTPGFLVMLHESILGKATRSTYGKTPEKVVLESYNLDAIRDQYIND